MILMMMKHKHLALLRLIWLAVQSEGPGGIADHQLQEGSCSTCAQKALKHKPLKVSEVSNSQLKLQVMEEQPPQKEKPCKGELPICCGHCCYIALVVISPATIISF